MPANKRRRELARAFVRNADRSVARQPEQREEVLWPEVLDGAGADGGEVEFARLRADLVHQVLHRCVGCISLYRADEGIDLEDCEVGEIAPLVRRFAVGGGQDDLRSDAREQQRIAVRRGVAHRLRADGTGSARLVLHDDRLAAKISRRVLREVARSEVGVAPGGERHDEVNGPRRVLCIQSG